MAEETEKKKAGAIEETPEIEKPPVSPPKTPTEMPEKTPLTPSEPVLETLPEKLTEEPPCQWFTNDMKFCEKIKKVVKCGGNVRKCPF